MRKIKAAQKKAAKQAVAQVLAAGSSSPSDAISKIKDSHFSPSPLDLAGPLMPRSKRIKASEQVNVRIPRPVDGRLMYTPQEVASVTHSHLMRPVTNHSRYYIVRLKKAMINQHRVPVKITCLNLIL